MEKKKKPFKLDVVSVRLIKDRPIYSEHRFDSPMEVVAVLGDVMSEFDREVVGVINLKTDLTPINVHFASIGAINEAVAHPREILKASILSNASSIILVHCHPSGVLMPSRSDTALTDRMNKVCELVGIPLLDHLIVGGNNKEFFSFKEKGMIKNPYISFASDYKTIEFGTSIISEKEARR